VRRVSIIEKYVENLAQSVKLKKNTRIPQGDIRTALLFCFSKHLGQRRGESDLHRGATRREARVYEFGALRGNEAQPTNEEDTQGETNISCSAITWKRLGAMRFEGDSLL